CQAEDGIRDFHVTGVQTCAFRSPAPAGAGEAHCGPGKAYAAEDRTDGNPPGGSQRADPEGTSGAAEVRAGGARLAAAHFPAGSAEQGEQGLLAGVAGGYVTPA